MHAESQLFIKKKEEIIHKVHKSSFLYLTTIRKMVGMVDRIRVRLQKQLKGFKESNNYQQQRATLDRLVLQIGNTCEWKNVEGKTIEEALEFDIGMQVKMDQISTAFALNVKTMTDYIKQRFKISTGFIKEQASVMQRMFDESNATVTEKKPRKTFISLRDQFQKDLARVINQLNDQKVESPEGTINQGTPGHSNQSERIESSESDIEDLDLFSERARSERKKNGQSIAISKAESSSSGNKYSKRSRSSQHLSVHQDKRDQRPGQSAIETSISFQRRSIERDTVLSKTRSSVSGQAKRQTRPDLKVLPLSSKLENTAQSRSSRDMNLTKTGHQLLPLYTESAEKESEKGQKKPKTSVMKLTFGNRDSQTKPGNSQLDHEKSQERQSLSKARQSKQIKIDNESSAKHGKTDPTLTFMKSTTRLVNDAETSTRQGVDVEAQRRMRVSIRSSSPMNRSLLSQSPSARYLAHSSVSPTLIRQITRQVKNELQTRQKRNHWNKPKTAMFNKSVQVYEDIQDELARKFKWRKEHTNKMVQTDDIITEELAMLQFQFRQSSHFGKFYKYVNPASMYGSQQPAFDQGQPMSKVVLEGDLYSQTTPKGLIKFDEHPIEKRRRTEAKRSSPLRVTKMKPSARAASVSKFNQQLKLQVEPVSHANSNKVIERGSSSQTLERRSEGSNDEVTVEEKLTNTNQVQLDISIKQKNKRKGRSKSPPKN